MSQLTEPIFDIQNMEDMVNTINSGSDYLRIAEGPIAEINKANPVATFKDSEEGYSLVAEGTNSGMITKDNQTPSSLEIQDQKVMSRTQRRDAHRRASLRLDIPSFKSMETGGQVASRFAPFAPRAALRIGEMCCLTTDSELMLEEKVSEIIHNSDEALKSPEWLGLLMTSSDDIDKVLSKLKVNQEILVKLLLKPLDGDNQIAVERRAAFGESQYHKIRVLIASLENQRKIRDNLERERMITFATIHKDMMKE